MDSFREGEEVSIRAALFGARAGMITNDPVNFR